MDAKAKERIASLQALEARLQNNALQKQQITSQVAEVDNALKELENNPKECYKIVANIMIAADKDVLLTDLRNKKELFDLKLKTIDKQEAKLKEEAESVQKEVMGMVKDGSEGN